MQEKLQREVRNARAIVIEQTPDTRFLALVNPFFSSSPFSPSPSTPPSFSLVVAGGCMLGEGVLEFVCVFFFYVVDHPLGLLPVDRGGGRKRVGGSWRRAGRLLGLMRQPVRCSLVGCAPRLQCIYSELPISCSCCPPLPTAFFFFFFPPVPPSWPFPFRRLVRADVRLQLRCGGRGPGQGGQSMTHGPCGPCYCQPYWCTSCLGKWFQSKQQVRAMCVVWVESQVTSFR